MGKARPWTKAEDSVLREVVSQQDSEHVNWQWVASQIEGRNNKECRKHWVYVLGPCIRKGKWEKAEDTLLQQGVGRYGTKWADVSRLVKSRQPDQCSKRWHEVLKPGINRDRWSFLDDNMLKNAVRAHGRAWVEIVERYFPQRTPLCVRNRYAGLVKVADRASPTISDSAAEEGAVLPPEQPVVLDPNPDDVRGYFTPGRCGFTDMSVPSDTAKLAIAQPVVLNPRLWM